MITIMKSTNDNLKFQAEHHELIQINNFKTIEQYCLHLIHQKAYHEASIYAKDKIVLDLGCNIGYGTNILSNHAKTIFGVDISSNAIQTAKETYQNSNINFKYFDGNTLPFEDNKFDLIVSFQVIEHIVDYNIYLNEMKRVLSPDGNVILTTPNSKLRLKKKGMNPWNPFHIREFSAIELKQLLDKYFQNVKIKGLFGETELYSIEYNRLIKMKNSKNKSNLRLKKITSFLNNLIRTFIKTILPNIVINKVKKLLQNPNSSTNNKHVEINYDKFNTNDLFYLEQNLNKALDLMAICKK